MKQIKFLLAALFLTVCFSVNNLFAVDTQYNQGTWTYQNVAGKWHYHLEVTIDSVGSGDIIYTPFIFIPATTSTYEYFRVIASNATGTEDFNVFFIYTNDPTDDVADAGYALESTDSDLDAVSTTAVYDTLGIVQGTASKNYKIYNWVALKIVNGQAVSASTITFDIGGDVAVGVDVGDIPAPHDSGD